MCGVSIGYQPASVNSAPVFLHCRQQHGSVLCLSCCTGRNRPAWRFSPDAVKDAGKQFAQIVRKGLGWICFCDTAEPFLLMSHLGVKDDLRPHAHPLYTLQQERPGIWGEQDRSTLALSPLPHRFHREVQQLWNPNFRDAQVCTGRNRKGPVFIASRNRLYFAPASARSS